jgi:CheY-like chemotaxis protein
MISHDPKDTIEIVLVDDNLADQEIARRVFGSQANVCKLSILSDGQQALTYLDSNVNGEVFGERELPDLILMDINMPSLSGIEVLRSIKADASLRQIPVLMLTTSSLESDIQDSYRLGCSSYILKPSDVPQFSSLLAQLLHYWTRVATLPDRMNREQSDVSWAMPGGSL